MANLGFVGLGLMGGRIVKEFLDAGHVVTGYNRTRAKAQWLIDAGMQWADSPRAVATASDITFSMVMDSHALADVVNGPNGVIAGLSVGKIYVDMSTVSPALTRELAARVSEKGAQMLEAPVSGGPPAIQAGTLVPYVGGNAAALDRVRPIFESISQKIIHVGANGQGMAMKVSINANLAAQLITLFESLLLAEKNGIPRAQALDAILNSVAASTHAKYRAPFILKMPDEVWFSINMMQKDVLLALDLGREAGISLPTVAYANELLTAARALGYGDQDFAALFKVVAHMTGMSEA
jgi:3-hydroxyisobutyrate dehydrogenase-like beta-hydroxyacid dehydrogenase